MQKQLGTIAAVIALLALAIFVIQNEGKKTRESIEDAGKEIANEVRGGIVDGVDRTIDKAAEVPGKVLRDAKDVLLTKSSGVGQDSESKSPESDRLDDASRPVKADEPKTTEPKPNATAADSRPDKITASEPNKETSPSTTPDQPNPAPGKPQPTDTPKTTAKTKPTPSADLNPEHLLRDTIKLGQGLTKTADDVGQETLGLSLAEEIRIGKDVNRQIIRQHKVANSPTATKRLRELAKPLLAQVKREEINYTFTVLASPEINAFSHLGGYVYVNQGLLNFAKSDAEVQFVIAHEIAHVELGHCRRGLTYTVRAGELAGGQGADLVQQAYHLIALGYSEEQEFDSDEWAFRHMLKIGRTQDEALALPRHFAKHFADKTERRQTADKDRPDAVIADEIEKHLRSHPLAAERVRRLDDLAKITKDGPSDASK
jgi:Zn-dependent protease with chaperone function